LIFDMQNKLASKFNHYLTELLGALATTGIEKMPLSTSATTLLTTSEQPQRLIVALSGGVDSVVLLHLLVGFQKLNSDFIVLAHNVNHGLSDNADSWGVFCTELCEKLDVTLISSKVEIEKKSRTSLEALAREARYQCFQERMHSNDIILTGHHQDDQLETLLLALKRGSGSTGLQGIRTSQAFFNGHLVRPLLNFSRQQLVDYALSFQLQWIEDESNQNIDFDRNFIRQKISPLLKTRWPAIAQSVSRTAQLCQEQQSLLNEIAQQDLSNCLCTHLSQQTLFISMLSKLSDARRNNVIRYWLKSNGLQYPSSKQLTVLWHEVALAQQDKQPQLQLGCESIHRYQDQLYIVAKQKLKLPEQPVIWAGESVLWLHEGRLGVDFSKVDASISKKHEVQCCLRQHLNSTLTCLPEGRNKARSIKKLLSEFQVPPWLRDQVVFVFIDQQLVEAVGLWRCQVKGIPQIKLSLLF
tara:strand:+ start:29651 stop:31057 length:1407 start_codon:yes stop_codon:yes gene_type:complete